MNLTVFHATRYRFEDPVPYGMQHVRLAPHTGPSQTVHDWSIEFDGVDSQATFYDHNENLVHLVRFHDHQHDIEIRCRGHVETRDLAGVLGHETGCTPPWYYKRTTTLTEPGRHIKALVKEIGTEGAELDRMHALSSMIAETVTYTPGETDATTTAEEGLERGVGVCQDHAHIFVGAARLIGIPARYVSGYLMMDDNREQSASHAWAEAFIDSLGWVGFDVSNGISPDERYIRIATGLDYKEAAPIFGIRFGGGRETLSVQVQIQQQ